MTAPTATRFQPLSIADLESLELPPREDVVSDGLLVAGSLTLFSAREKSGKTLLSTDLACAIACEQPFLDRAVACRPVVFVALEENTRDVRQRFLDRLDGQRGVPLYVLPANGYDDTVFRIDSAESMGALVAMIHEFDAGVVIVDTMREAHRQRENEGDDMGPLMRPLRQIAHDTNCAIILLHHQNKSGGSRGSTAIAAGVDQLWAFDRTDADNDAGPPVGKLTVEGRFGPRQVLGIRLGDGLRWIVDNAVMVADQTMRAQILGLLAQSPNGLTADEIAASVQRNRKTAQNEISHLLREEPAPIIASGAGTKGSPRRYRSVSPVLFPTPKPSGNPSRESFSGNGSHSSGNNGNLFEGVAYSPWDIEGEAGSDQFTR